jgi:hypothetical protein
VLDEVLTHRGRRLELDPEPLAHVVRVEDELERAAGEEVGRGSGDDAGTPEDHGADRWVRVSDDGHEDP